MAKKLGEYIFFSQSPFPRATDRADLIFVALAK